MTDYTTWNAERVVQDDLRYVCGNLEHELAQLAGKSLLITGGAGFLGHYLVQAITHFNATADRPVQLTVFDNLSRGMPPWLRRLADDGTLRLVRHDMAALLPADIGDFDYIVHGASIASPIYYRRDPIGTMDANINGLRNLLDLALRRHKAAADTRFLFFSSSEIYGDPEPAMIPTPETYPGRVSCTGPRACYDESKRFGESLCVNFFRQHGLPVMSARPFNNYGPGLKITDGRVLPDFARDVLAGRDIVMLSDGSAKRTFCYVADAVVGYYKVLVRGQPGEAYNIGIESPEISVAELAAKVVGAAGELFGYKGKVVHRRSKDSDYLVDNPSRRCPVIAKAREHLGYNPTISVDDGLRRALVWYSGNREAEER